MNKGYINKIRKLVGNEKIILVFSGAIIYNEKGILLQRRKEGGLWGLPGGFMELGESLIQCCVREIYEETGIKMNTERIELHGIYSKYFDKYPSGDLAQPVGIVYKYFYEGELKPFMSDETIEIKFFSLEEIPDIFNDQNKDIINDFKENNNKVYYGR